MWIFALAERQRSHHSHSQQSVVANQPTETPESQTGIYSSPVLLARLQSSAIAESSGIVASRNNPGLYWTHNDSGDGPFIYAFDREGMSRGVWRITGASARDWEDIAAGPGPLSNRGYLYLGDIGDNSLSRSTIVVYRVPEPLVAGAETSTAKNPEATETAETIQLNYPDGPHNAEALLVHPTSGDLYVVTKEPLGTAGVYKASAPLDTVRTVKLTFIGGLKSLGIMGGAVTGGDISPDGRRVALSDYMQGYEIELGDREKGSFDAIWKQPISVIALGQRKQGEAICYSLDGKALLTTSEGKHSPLIEVVRR